jgi:adenylate cyclase
MSEDGGREAALLRELGVPEEAIERALERGEPEIAVLESAFLEARAERTVTPSEVEARGGLPADEIAELFQAMGLAPPAPDEPALTEEEAEVYVELHRLRDIWPRELRQQVARVYGRLLARIARTGVQVFRLQAEPRIRERSADQAEHLSALHEAFPRLLSLPDALLTGVHRRWLEYEVAQTTLSAAQLEGPDAALPGAVDVTLLFCDLKDFTAYANAEGDAAAVEIIDAFVRTVDAERGEEGRVVKVLGDGHMISYDDPVPAVEAGARIIAGMRTRDSLGVHASVHRGVAIAREGDYFGSAVNLAARLLNAAGRDELVGTESVVASCGDDFDWEPIGARQIRGVDEPVEVFRLRTG